MWYYLILLLPTLIQCVYLDMRKDFQLNFHSVDLRTHPQSVIPRYVCKDVHDCPLSKTDIRCQYSAKVGWKCTGTFAMNQIIDTVDVQCKSPRNHWITTENCKLVYTLKEMEPTEFESKYQMSPDDLTHVTMVFYVMVTFIVTICGMQFLHKARVERMKYMGIQSLDDCIICQSKKKCWASIKCGHVCYCEECYKLPEIDKTKCPMCRELTNNWIRIYD
jgi:hypothetical protein